jgi:hypothetical protein
MCAQLTSLIWVKPALKQRPEDGRIYMRPGHKLKGRARA